MRCNVQQKQLSIDQALMQAGEHFKAGRLPEAEKIYRAILQTQPAHALANHNLGLIAHRVGRNDVEARPEVLVLSLRICRHGFEIDSRRKTRTC